MDALSLSLSLSFSLSLSIPDHAHQTRPFPLTTTDLQGEYLVGCVRLLVEEEKREGLLRWLGDVPGQGSQLGTCDHHLRRVDGGGEVDQGCHGLHQRSILYEGEREGGREGEREGERERERERE